MRPLLGGHLCTPSQAERKKNLPNATRSVQDDVFCRERHSSRAVSLPRVRPVCTWLNKTPVPASTAAPASRGEPRHRGPTFDGTPGLDLPGSTQRQQKPRGKATVRPRGWSVCLHSPFPQIQLWFSAFTRYKLSFI